MATRRRKKAKSNIIGLSVVKWGRPRKFETVDDLLDRAKAYIADRQKKRQPVTVTGLCIVLGTTRETMMDYESGKYDGAEGAEPRFSDAVKQVKQFVVDYAENQLYLNGKPAGPIFALKNFGWSDKVDHNITDPGRDSLAKQAIELGNGVKVVF